ncbi:hypothetical protein F511_35330 [Dorcoceras hygrometricum]|uniref:Uncharacterized protein n=1 Tax=Dorcoceras hygrometricum TaxID=472368 RepID=A0A2Z7C3T0_9LAMI|nr:hypothetical protein F511_35330 [Dorcoceras hygrometricum]
MAYSLFVNTLQVDFASVFAMEYTGMILMFKYLEDTGLRGFLEGTTSVFENAVTEFFVNAKVIAETIVSTVCNCKLVVTEDIFFATFKLPIEGITDLADIPKETIVEMLHRFSATDEPFKTSSKKIEKNFEYRMLHDIVSKFLCAKSGSFDTVTCEKFEFMFAISTGISVNWGRILFQRLLSVVQNPKKQSQGYTVPISILMETLVNDDLGASIKIHPQKRTEDTASNIEVSRPHQIEPAVTEYLAAKKKGVDKPTKRKATGEGQKKKKRKAAAMAKQIIEMPSVEIGRQVAPTNFDSEESSEPDSCPLVARRCKRKQADESSDLESTISFPIKNFAKRRRTQRQHTQMGWTGANIASQPDPIPVTPTKEECLSGQDNFMIGSEEPDRMDFDQNKQGGDDDWFKENMEFDSQMEHEGQKDTEVIAVVNKPIPFEEHYRLVLSSTWSTLLEWGETEEVSELFERRSLILYKLFEIEVEKVYHEHLANFKHDAPSMNHDYLCIRHLHKELKGSFAPVDIREINSATHFLPKIDPASKGKEILESYAFPNLVEFHCLLVLNSAYEDVSNKMSEYDKWAHFRTEVRLNTVTSMSSIAKLAKIEDQFMFLDETELVSDLLERRMLVLYKLYEIEKRALRLQAGLPLLVPESSIAGSTQDDLLMITCTMGRITSTLGTTPAQEQKRNRLRNRSRGFLPLSIGLKRKNNQLRRTKKLRGLSNRLKSRFRRLFVLNNEDRQGPSPSGLQIVRYTAHSEEHNSSDNEEDFAQSGPQPVDFPDPKLILILLKSSSLKDLLSSLGSNIDRIGVDTYITKHTTLQFWKQLENTYTGWRLVSFVIFPIANRTLQVAEMVDCLKEIRDDKKEEGPSSKKRRLL